MKRGNYRPRHGSYTEPEIAELWVRRAAGETGTRIARHMGLDATALRDYFHKAGGIRPRPRKRSGTALSLADREEISRGLAAADSLRTIAARISRSPSTVSREVARNHGRQSYRAGSAEQLALRRRRRPKPAKLTVHSKLWAEVVAHLELNWSPEQISRFLKEEHPKELSMQVSHETIYLSLYVQGRGLLRKELTKHLRRRHQIRQPKRHEQTNRGRIKDMILISERPAEVADRLKVGDDARVVVRSRRYLLDGRPVETAVSYIPADLAKGTPISDPNPGPGGIYARLEEQGHTLERFTEEVSARMPTPQAIRLLALPPGVPVFRLVRTAYDIDGRAVEVCDTIMVADAYLLAYELPAH